MIDQMRLDMTIMQTLNSSNMHHKLKNMNLDFQRAKDMNCMDSICRLHREIIQQLNHRMEQKLLLSGKLGNLERACQEMKHLLSIL
jgi:hypothetical protein